MRHVLVTGSAGFIGYHLCSLLLDEGFEVHGYDGLTEYYDVGLKKHRHEMLRANRSFHATEAMLGDYRRLSAVVSEVKPDIIVHLAAQAGVRYSIENPRVYVDSNIVGTFNVMEAAREIGVSHLLMASTSSVYGGSIDLPFRETDRLQTPLTIYAASKIACEAMAHSHAHLWHIPTTMFRFFTAYGPWGRPDMAPFKFVDAILKSQPIDVYNHGEMFRDFTYVADVVHAIRLLIDVPPERPDARAKIPGGDSLSPVAPYRVVNIGNAEKVRLIDFIEAVEKALGRCSERNYMPMQMGELPGTWADATLLETLTGYRPRTALEDGVAKFVTWFRDYYGR